MTPARLRGLVIGAGYFASFHLDAWSRIPEVELTAVCDRNEARARELAARSGVPRVYSDARAALDAERPDFVDIVTPPDTHEDLCREAAARGVPILCQKPLAPTLDAARRIVALAAEAGVRLLVHENFRWQPWYRRVKQLQRDDDIGVFTHVQIVTRLGDGWGDDAYLARQPYFRDYPQLLVFETGVHFIDTFRFLLGEVTSVYAQLRRLNPVIAGEDAGQIVLRFDSGATAIWDANRYNESESVSPRYTFGEMRIDGMGGHVTLDGTGRLRLKRLGQPARDLAYVHEDRGFGGDCVYHLQQQAAAALRDGTPFETEGREYLKTMAVAEAAYISASRGQVVALA